MKKSSVNLLALLLAVLLCACGPKAEPETAVPPVSTVEPTPKPASEPAIDPTPTPVPEGEPITFEGEEMSTYLIESQQCLLVSEALERLGCDVSTDGSFEWRKQTMSISDKYMEVYDFCELLDIGTLFDDENSHLYCTAAAGSWELPQGYDVPVFMYHGTGAGSETANLFVSIYDLEQQFIYLTENGYSPIWFEDLWHVEDFEKPVILVFDDGWRNNYTNLFPLAKQYNVKVTIAIVPDFIDRSANHLTSEMIDEMNSSGLVRFESHTMTHNYLYDLPEEEQRWELEQSRLEITRRTGIQPIALIYPSGTNTEFVRNTLINEEHIYRFGVLMLGMRSYNTSDDPALVYRFWPERSTSLAEYSLWLENTFKEYTELHS